MSNPWYHIFDHISPGTAPWQPLGPGTSYNAIFGSGPFGVGGGPNLNLGVDLSNPYGNNPLGSSVYRTPTGVLAQRPLTYANNVGHGFGFNSGLSYRPQQGRGYFTPFAMGYS